MHTLRRSLARMSCLALVAVANTACDQMGEASPGSAPLEPVFARGASGNPHAEPVVFAPGVVSSEQEEYRITFTPDGKTAYFGRAEVFFPASRQAWIYETHLVDGEWTTPVVAPFSGVYSDIDPFISPDGTRLFFSSIRPVNGEPRLDADTWMVERTPTGWSEPINLGPAVNSRNDDLYASADAAGNLYFASTRALPDGSREFPNLWNIWRSRYVDGEYQPAELLGPGVNSDDSWQFNPAISPDGRRLVFTRLNVLAQQETNFGEIHVSHLHQGQWTPAQNLGYPVNTELDEYHPSFSADGKYLFFARRDPLAEGAQGDLMYIKTAFLGNRLRPGYTVPGAVGGR